MSKSKYVSGSEAILWAWFNTHQNSDTDFSDIGVQHGISAESAKKLHLLWASGAKDSFNQAYFSLFDGAPTSF